MGELKTSVAKRLSQPLVGRAIRRAATALGRRSLTVDGITLPVDGSIHDSVLASVVFRFYESAERRLVRQHLVRNLPVVELGASSGVVSSTAAALLEPGQTYVAVEANEALIEPLRSMLAQNAAHLRFSVEWAAVGIPAGADARFLSSASPISGRVSLDGSGEVTPATSLGELLAKSSIDTYNLIADIEGCEHAVIADEVAALARCESIIIELHEGPADERPNDLVERLGAMGFDAVGFDGAVAAFRRARS